jgi:hypothetical protein
VSIKDVDRVTTFLVRFAAAGAGGILANSLNLSAPEAELPSRQAEHKGEHPMKVPPHWPAGGHESNAGLTIASPGVPNPTRS